MWRSRRCGGAHDAGPRHGRPRLPAAIAACLDISTVVTDRQGRLLRAFALPKGMWRLPVTADQVDPKFIRLLTVYEDKRFASHHGVDPLALLRSFGQAIIHGRIVSGGSTLTMQLARLIEGAARAHAPCQAEAGGARFRSSGGSTSAKSSISICCVRPMAAMSRNPRRRLDLVRQGAAELTLAEAALLVIPCHRRRRPDRDGGAAQRSRKRVLDRALAAGLIDAGDRAQAMAQPIPAARRQLPFMLPISPRRRSGGRRWRRRIS